MSFPSLASPLLLVMWAQLLVVVVVARVFGSLMRRWGQPPVVGELLAGVLLGPSVFAQVWPAGWSWLFPHNAVAAAPLNAFGWLGVGLFSSLPALRPISDWCGAWARRPPGSPPAVC